VAHNAGLALEWLPMIRPSVQDSSAPPARYQVHLRGAVGPADTLLFVEGRNAAGVLVMNERVTGSAADPFTWGRSVADRVVSRLFPERTVDFHLLANSTDNVQALHAWYRGSAAFQAARWDEAERHYAEALRRDPDFLAASWSMLLTTMWRREPYQDELHALLLRADALPSTIGRLLHAQIEPHLPTRVALLDSLAAANPGFAPARMLLANELFHRGPLIGRRLGEGVDAFVSAARDVPDLNHRTTWQHVLWGAIRLGDVSLASDAWQRLSQWPGDEELTAFLGLGLDARFSTAVATPNGSQLERLATGDGLEAMSRYLRLGLDFDIPHDVQRMAQLVADRATDPDIRAAALATRATTELMRGQVTAALASLDTAASVAHDTLPYQLQAAEWRTLLPVLGVPVDSGEQADGERALRAIAADRKYWPRAAWALAVSALSTRDPDQRWGDSLSNGASRHPVAVHLLPLWRAHQSAAAMRVAEALDFSSAIHHDPEDAIVVARGPLARAVTYLARGRWQLQLGDSVAAEREWRWHENNDLQGWPSGPPQDGELDAALSVLGRLRRAELLCRHRQVAEGRLLFSRANQLLDGADPALGSAWPVRSRAAIACG
jgi:tetratricopeptide (TPR) repeat protein